MAPRPPLICGLYYPPAHSIVVFALSAYIKRYAALFAIAVIALLIAVLLPAEVLPGCFAFAPIEISTSSQIRRD
ncbi:hypothetical protein TUZN_0856 [Thermoproteus uzoniensis 768-20]|uniref:Uncharacterized protein n=1 Tax=Thermoproteus uzoniensis (strain 768-20) TaxID=999630 RepID=F2L5H1_THEU7|nr:hypothetical protein TUZN_0856 [Thermoproteus uzoniensis 768-20]